MSSPLGPREASASGSHPDLDLVRRALARDPVALREVGERLTCVPRILRHLNRRRQVPLGEADLEDAVQDTLVKLWTRLDSFEGRASLGTWAYSFCGYGLHSAESKKGRSREQDLEDEHLLPLSDRAHLDPADQVQSDDFVFQCLDRIGPPPSTVIYLKLFGGLSFPEVASELGITVSAAKAWYYRGLERVRRSLSPDAGETQ